MAEGRYFADIHDEDGRWYVFDDADDGAEACGPFDTAAMAMQAANDLNTDDDLPGGLRANMIQRRLTS